MKLRGAILVLLAAATVAQADDDPLRLAFEWHVAGGLSAAATCVANAAPADGGPQGGRLVLSDLPAGAQVQAAYLYWSVISPTSPVPEGAPTLDGVPLLPVRVGELPTTPCFDENGSNTGIFRADVAGLVTGNGTFAVAGFPFETASTFTEGATLVVAWCGGGGSARATHVLLWEGIDVTRDLDPVRPIFRQQLTGFTAPSSAPVTASLLVVGGNGQGRGPDDDVDPFLFQGVDLDAADPSILSGGLCPPSGLYDLTLLDVGSLIPAGATSASLEIRATSDCHTIGAVALAIAEDGGGAGGGEPSALDLRPGAEPLRVAKAAAGTLRVTWEAMGAPSDVHAGTIGRFYDHAPLACDLAAPSVEAPAGSGDRYFLAVTQSCGADSSYGRSSFGVERPDARTASGAGCR